MKSDGTMTYEEFEWHILRLVYEEGLEKLRPSYLAYALGLPHDQVTEFLEEAAAGGVVDMRVVDEGRIEYSIPGLDRGEELPAPIWKDIEEQFDLQRPENAREPSPAPTDHLPATRPGAEPPQDAPPPAEAVAHVLENRSDDDTPVTNPGATSGDGYALTRREQQPDDSADYDRLAVAQHPQLPSSIRRHIEARYSATDGAMIPFEDSSPIVSTDASVDDPTQRTMSALDDANFPFRIEACDDTYCDPTQTVFMRQIRVHGVESEEQLRYHVQRLFESFGYRTVQAEDDRVRFERGSVTFILALVPLFVLVLPLFVYLFLYCMGRSTIHQEPVELDVQFRRDIEDGEPVYEIDLTFIGLHGVVLGAADQRVLNQEIDTLRDELRWSLSPG